MYNDNYDKASMLEENLINDFINLRHSLGLSQQKMAEECGAIREMVTALENRRKHPQILTMIKFLEPFGYTLKITKIESEINKRKYL